MSEQAMLAIPAFVRKQLEPLLEEIEGLKRRIDELEKRGKRRTLADRLIEGERK